MEEQDRKRLVRGLFRDEIVDYEIFTRLAKRERDGDLKVLLGRLAKMEKAHMRIWAEMAGTKEPELGMASWTMAFKIYAFIAARMLLGVAFVIMLLGKNEIAALERYNNAIRSVKLSAMDRKLLDTVIADEKYNEVDLKEKIKEYKGQLNYIRSIVFGLNDGLVEVLAAVAGIAVVATSGSIVIVAGVIIGISGTLSMAGGSYLSAKSHNLMEDIGEDEKSRLNMTPMQEASYTGVYYFLGSLVAVVPFILGLVGFEGIIAAVVLVSLVLTTVSVIVAVVSGTSIRKRVFEMLAISLGAVVVTVILGTVARTYFGVVI
ncbi:MAG TPA: VIT1/CCC1 transporter family protein [Candidatus Saccharimonadales bacterium]|nr:VIT1/CCC1 transporter family protein [Candidatus Saccharimonadales bacterium]